jgi:hypothetical protein
VIPNTMSSRIVLGSVLLSALVSGCSFYARGADDYRDATRDLLQTRGIQIQGCYNEVLGADRNAKGVVAIHFTMTEKTGALANPEVLPESTAPAALSDCVVKALVGLVLDPPDQRKGDATFRWEFSSKS